jgi:hypothetical protein
MIDTQSTAERKPGKPNPFKLDSLFSGDQKFATIKRKKSAGKDTPWDAEFNVQVELVTGGFGAFLSSGKKDSPTARYTISAKREIPKDAMVAKTPVAYMTITQPGAEKGETVCNLFKQQSDSGRQYLKGTNRDTGEVYFIFVQDKADQK